MSPSGAAEANSRCRNGGHGLQQRWTRCAGMVDTRGEHGLPGFGH
ncbi:hypothetical protein [Kibdelosporangium philippinense]